MVSQILEVPNTPRQRYLVLHKLCTMWMDKSFALDKFCWGNENAIAKFMESSRSPLEHQCMTRSYVIWCRNSLKFPWQEQPLKCQTCKMHHKTVSFSWGQSCRCDLRCTCHYFKCTVKDHDVSEYGSLTFSGLGERYFHLLKDGISKFGDFPPLAVVPRPETSFNPDCWGRTSRTSWNKAWQWEKGIKVTPCLASIERTREDWKLPISLSLTWHTPGGKNEEDFSTGWLIRDRDFSAFSS